MWRHSCEQHGGHVPEFVMNVTGTFRNDAMLRQITESVLINKIQDSHLINNKSEWNYVAFQELLLRRRSKLRTKNISFSRDLVFRHLLVMPAFSAKDDGLAVKLVSRFYENEKQGCSSLCSYIMVLDSRNGFLKAIMDGIVITKMRTAAASAVATKYLASKDAGILCILGSGAQARSHAQTLKLVRGFTEIRVWSRTFANAQKFADEIGAKACSTVEEAASGADVIVTVTLATTPILFGKWVKPGALINSVGAPRPTQRELDDEIMQNSFIVADSSEAALKEAGDVILSQASVSGEIGDVISGKLSVPKGKTKIFKSLGMAVEDVVSAKLVLSKLEGSGVPPLTL